MSCISYEDLIIHAGHKIVVVTYGKNKENVCCECETCNTIIMDWDKGDDLE